MDLIRIFGANVRRVRQERGLTQEQLALEAGMKRSYLSELERGERNPTIRALDRLASALNIGPDELLKRNPRVSLGSPNDV